jgi:hypothetical protein
VFLPNLKPEKAANILHRFVELRRVSEGAIFLSHLKGKMQKLTPERSNKLLALDLIARAILNFNFKKLGNYKLNPRHTALEKVILRSQDQYLAQTRKYFLLLRLSPRRSAI